MIRTTLLWMLVAFVGAYGFKDWFKALCGLILLMAVVQHPDFPKSIFGIQGLNAWNVLLAIVVIAWLSERKKEQHEWDFPIKIQWLLAGYMLLIIIASARMFLDTGGLADYNAMNGAPPPDIGELIGENIINRFKWIIPALMVFDGARSRKRVLWVLASTLVAYLLIALQIIKAMGIRAIASGSKLELATITTLPNEVGYHRVNLACMMAGAAWALYSFAGMVDKKSLRAIVLFGVGIIFIGLALTGGRTGYVTWSVLGLGFAIVKWRWMLLIGPLGILVLMVVAPAPFERLQKGIGGTNVDENEQIEETQYVEGDISWYTVTSGRTFAWPFVVERIRESPWIGYGEEAMKRTGLAQELFSTYGESFPHPHNLYLQWTFDNGLIGLFIVFWFYFIVTKYGISALNYKGDPLISAVGGAALALVGALFVAGVGSQTFYPREGAVGMWIAIALVIRVHMVMEVQRGVLARSRMAAASS